VCVHVICVGLTYYGDEYKALMPNAVRQLVTLTQRTKTGRPSNLERCRSFWG
jgi:hypothetical protein